MIAYRRQQLNHGARDGRGNLHGSLVRFQHDEALVQGHLITHCHQQFDDFSTFRTANIGDCDLLYRHVLFLFT
jgi:hypothetical protein